MSGHDTLAAKLETNLREEFNRWADAGRGEAMEDHHRPITDPTLALMDLRPDDTVLDLGCGTGWLCRTIASRVGDGQVVGMDVSDAMVHRACDASAHFHNLTFLTGTADRIVWGDDYFTKVISVESAYYWPDPARGIREILRVLRPGGSAWILINYYRDNPHCHQWGALLSVPVHLLSAAQWAELFHAAGFTDVDDRRIPDLSPTPEPYTGRWFRDAAQMRQFKAEGALLIVARKPGSKGGR